MQLRLWGEVACSPCWKASQEGNCPVGTCLMRACPKRRLWNKRLRGHWAKCRLTCKVFSILILSENGEESSKRNPGATELLKSHDPGSDMLNAVYYLVWKKE